MERKQVQLLSFIHQNKKEGSILFVSIAVLLIISSILLSIIFSAFSNSASKYEQFNAACKISVALSKSSNNCCGVFCVSASRLQIIQSLPY